MFYSVLYNLYLNTACFRRVMRPLSALPGAARSGPTGTQGRECELISTAGCLVFILFCDNLLFCQTEIKVIYFINLICSVCCSADCLSKPLALSTVYCWGNGITVPVRLPLPNNDTQVAQVSAGRTQKAAVTRNGRLLLWEVNLSSFSHNKSNFIFHSQM